MIPGVESLADHNEESVDSTSSEECVGSMMLYNPSLPFNLTYSNFYNSSVNPSKLYQAVVKVEAVQDDTECQLGSKDTYAMTRAGYEPQCQTFVKPALGEYEDYEKLVMKNNKVKDRDCSETMPTLLMLEESPVNKLTERSNIHPKKFWSYASAIENYEVDLHSKSRLGDSYNNDFPNSSQAGSQSSTKMDLLLAAEGGEQYDLNSLINKTMDEVDDLPPSENIENGQQKGLKLSTPPNGFDEEIYTSTSKSHMRLTVSRNTSPRIGAEEDEFKLTMSVESCNGVDPTTKDAADLGAKRASSAESYFCRPKETPLDFCQYGIENRNENHTTNCTSSAKLDENDSRGYFSKNGSCIEAITETSDPQQINEEGTTELSSSSPFTCEVCGEAANGNFFGAIVCLPCKSFFIRCTKDNESCIVRQCGGHCDINKQLRNRCQFCRYQRCLMVGMTRKEKPESIQAQDGQELCRVCGDLSNGIHFGVFTCEGCKKFFRRGLKEHSSYMCKEQGMCRLTPRNRNSCRLCRYQKCISVGMSRTAIKMGRPRKLFAKWDVIEGYSSHAYTNFQNNSNSIGWRSKNQPSHNYDESSFSRNQSIGTGFKEYVFSRRNDNYGYYCNSNNGHLLRNEAGMHSGAANCTSFTVSPNSRNEIQISRSGDFRKISEVNWSREHIPCYSQKDEKFVSDSVFRTHYHRGQLKMNDRASARSYSWAVKQQHRKSFYPTVANADSVRYRQKQNGEHGIKNSCHYANSKTYGNSHFRLCQQISQNGHDYNGDNIYIKPAFQSPDYMRPPSVYNHSFAKTHTQSSDCNLRSTWSPNSLQSFIEQQYKWSHRHFNSCSNKVPPLNSLQDTLDGKTCWTDFGQKQQTVLKAMPSLLRSIAITVIVHRYLSISSRSS